MPFPHPPSEHFQGKSVVEHLKEARSKGTMTSSEIHGTEMPGFFSALCDASRETALLILLFWVIDANFKMTLLFSFGLLLWKTGRSALLGWSRMERLHRLIEEERWEIEHHRAQEREELTEMYRAKGLEGKLLEEVIDVLMADDNRLLRVMLEEELGLTLEAIDHPLKQAFGAFLGVAFAASLSLFALWAFFGIGLLFASLLTLSISAILSIRLERNALLNFLVWHLAIAAVSATAAYLLQKVL